MAENQYVVFELGKEEYGIDIMNVKEIVPYQESVKIPNAPAFVKGIINFRGNVIPIVDLKKKFNLPESEIDSDTRIIVIYFEDKLIGFIVDEASQTLRLEDENIDPTPDVISSVDRRYITGVGKQDNRLIILIDLEKVLTEEEKARIDNLEV